MEYCSNCKQQLAKGQAFCTKCGQSAATNQEVASAHHPQQEEPQRSPRKSISKKTKVLSASILAAVVVLGGGYYAVDKIVMSPRAVSEGFVKALKEKDIDKVKSYINEGQIELSANDEQTKSFVEYLHRNPKVLSSINDGLSEETASYEETGTLDEVSDETQSPYAHLQKDGKEWGIFDHYAVRVNPAYANVVSSEEGAIIYVDNQKVGKVNNENGEKSVGPFLPGTHKIKAVIKNEDGSVSDEQSVDMSEEETASVYFDWSDYEVNIDDSDDVGNHEEIEAKNDTAAAEEADIKDAITSHYNLITSDDFSAAYNYFASSRKSSVDLTDWSKGLQANSRDDVTDVQVTAVDENEAKADIKMTSYDDNEDGSTLVQEWEGSWDLVKENEEWRLSEAHLEKVDSRTE
ncbi:TcaA second domain-containing protein [Priestia megaterium]